MFQESRQSNSKRKSHIKHITPATHSSIKQPSAIIDKKFESTMGNNRIELTYSSRPCPEFGIKIIERIRSTVSQLELTNEFLSQGDPAVLATFQNVESMYTEFCEILRTQPTDFEICQNGTLKVRITVSMKSTIRKRQLVLQTQMRAMSETEQLKLLMESEQEAQRKVIKALTDQQDVHRKTLTELADRAARLQKQLSEVKQQNVELKRIIHDLNNSTKAEVEQIKHRISKQREQTQNILSELRQSVEQMRQGMNKMNFSLKLLMSGAKKIHLTLDVKNRCLKSHNKQNSFTSAMMQQQCERYTKITKVGKDKWGQVLFQYAISHPVSYFEFEVTKTKNNYICVGMGSLTCLQQQDSKWSKTSITLFLLDRSIICQGKTVDNPSISTVSNGKLDNASSYSSVKSMKSNSETMSTNSYRVVINLLERTITWFENQIIIGAAVFSEQYSGLCKGNQIRPLLICSDQDDQIILI